MKKYIKFCFIGVAIVLLSVACTITPERIEKQELKPATTKIASPVITEISTDNSVDNPSITVTWETVDKATFYVFEYINATDYLSGSSNFKSFVTNSNTYTLASSAFTNTADMRYVFRVKAAFESDSRSIIYSNESELKEATILNSFTMSPVIQDNVLTMYTSYPKIKSVLGNGNIIQPTVKYYDTIINEDDSVSTADENTEENTDSDKTVDAELIELEDNTITLSSSESKTITGILYVDDIEITRKSLPVKNSADYYPSSLLSITATSNTAGGIALEWEANAINAGLEEYSPKMQFRIERKESGKDVWAFLKDEDGNVLYVAGSNDGGTFSYKDTSAETGKEYVYRVITQYVLTINEVEVSFDEDEEKAPVSDTAYMADSEVKSFTVTPRSGFDGEPVTGDATYQVDLAWSSYHTLPSDMEYVVTRWDFDQINYVDGNPTSRSLNEKSVTVYKGSATSYTDSFTLSSEANKKAVNYTYYIQIADKNTGSTGTSSMTQAKTVDSSGKEVDGIIKTNPTIKPITFITSLGATGGDSALSDKISLKWSYNESQITSAELSMDKVSVRILKKTSTDSSYSVCKEVSGTSYDDSDVSAGVTYSYILQPCYNDSSSPYNGAQTAESEKQATGNILSAVSSVNATVNTHNSKIEVSWEAVTGAKGYKIYTRKKGETVWAESAKVTSGTSYSLSSGITPGVVYEISVGLIDSAGNSKPSSEIVYGEILGNTTVTATGEKNIKADYIAVTWSPVENATAYIISVYDDENNEVYKETRSASSGCSFILRADSEIITAYAETHEYALSRKYSFAVTPKVGSTTPSEVPTKVEGYWVMPPRNVVATKASYRDLITISWDAVANARGYVIYYHEHGSSREWQYFNNISSTSIDFITSSGKYDFSVSTISSGNIEGVKQTYFKNESNYGYPLSAPQRVSCVDMGDGKYFKLSFMEVEGATSYQIKFEDSTWTLNASDISNSLSSIAANKAGKDSDGLISYYINRPAAKYKVTFNASVAATNNNATISSKNTTSYVSSTVMYQSLNDTELIKIAKYNLNYIFRLVNDYFGNEWWDSSRKTLNASGVSASSCWGVDGIVRYNPKNNGYINLSNYNLYGNTISGNISCYVKANQTGGWIGEDPLERVSTSNAIRVQLPGKYPDITITFNNYYVYNNSGTATVTINSQSYDFKSYSPTLLEEEKE